MSVESVSRVCESSVVRTEKNVVALLAWESRPLAPPTPSEPVVAGALVAETFVDLKGGGPIVSKAGGLSISAASFGVPVSVSSVILVLCSLVSLAW